jgi:hypothetical protein
VAEVKLTGRQQAALLALARAYGRERDRNYLVCGHIAGGIERWMRHTPHPRGWPIRRVDGWNAYPTAQALVKRGLAVEGYGGQGGACDWQRPYAITDAGIRWLAEHGIHDVADLPPFDHDARSIPGAR